MYNKLSNLKRFGRTCTFLTLVTTNEDVNKAKIIKLNTKTFNNDSDFKFPSQVDTEVDTLNFTINPKSNVSKVLLNKHNIDDVKQLLNLQQVSTDIQQTLLNTQFLITYNGLDYDLPVLSNEFIRCKRPFNFKHSKHHNLNGENDVMQFIDVYKVVDAEIRSLVFDYCKANDIQPNLRLKTVFNYITNLYYDSLGIDAPDEDISEIDMIIRIFIGLIEHHNINMYQHITCFYNIRAYELTLEKDSNIIITRNGKYADIPLKEFLNEKDSKKTSWLLSQHKSNNLTLSKELINELYNEVSS